MTNKRIGVSGFLAYAYTGVLGIYYVLRALGRQDQGWVALFGNFVPLALIPAPLVVMLSWWKRNRVLTAAGLGLMGALVGSLRLRAPARGKDHPGSPLRVLTHNVGRALVDEDRLRKLITESQADLVLLQEISQDGGARCFDALRHLYPFSAFGALSLLDRDMGMAVMSRSPILSNEDLKLTEDGVVVQQRVRVSLESMEADPLTIYNVHLTLPWIRSRQRGRISVPYYDDALRRAEVSALLHLVSDEADAVLLAGDFNLHDQSGDYDRLAAKLVDAFGDAGSGWGFTWPLSSSPGIDLPIAVPVVRIDYLFVSRCFTALDCQLLDPTGSDHRPLLVDLGLPVEPMHVSSVRDTIVGNSSL